MDPNLRSGLIAGVIAAIIWLAITLIGQLFSAGTIIVWAIVFLVGTAAVTFTIATLVGRTAGRTRS